MITTPVQKNNIWSQQSLFFAPVSYDPDLNFIFQNKLPKTPYEDEMSKLEWVDLETLMRENHISRSLEQLKPILPDLAEIL
jgi:hypothetical protein